MKNTIFLLLFFFFVGEIFASSDSTRLSWMETYQNSPSEKRVEAANRFYQQLYDEQFVDSAVHFTSATPLDSMQKKMYFAATEYCFYELGDFDSALLYGEEALRLCRKVRDLSMEGQCHSMLAIIYFRRSDFVSALRHAQADLALQRELKDVSATSSALNTLAGIYLASQRGEEALRYIKEAISLSSSVKDSSRVAIQMGMAAEILLKLDRSEEALQFAQRAFVVDSLRGDSAKMAIRLSQKAAALIASGHHEEAESILRKALPILKKCGNWQSASICQNLLGELLLRKKDYAESAALFEEALHFFYPSGDKYNEAKTRRGLYLAYRHDNPDKAMVHLERLCSLKDSLYAIEMEENLSMAHAKYVNEELLQENEHERRIHRLTVAAGIAVLSALAALLGFACYALHTRKRRINLLRQLQETKKQFLTHITHEFKTPLTVVLGLSRRLKGGQLNANETVPALAESIERQGKTLLELVNQLLDIARTDSVSVEGHYYYGDVVGYIHMIVESCSELAKKKHITLRYVPAETRAEIDYVPDYLRKMVQNLLTNAIKFTHDYGNVMVLSQFSSDKRIFSISVKDDGEGIPESQLPYIFEAFRGRPGTDGESSTGVGLVLVKKLVEALGGTIAVESKVAKGCCFTLFLPCSDSKGIRVTDSAKVKSHDVPVPGSDGAPLPEKSEGNIALQMETSVEQYSILLIEDNIDIAYYIENVLKPEGYHLSFARNGAEGWEKALAIVPDLIITDIMMPVMDGFELCQRLKASAVTNHIPVIVVTARTSEEDKLKGLDCGVECYLKKPFVAEELLVRVHNLFERHRILCEKFRAARMPETVAEVHQKECAITLLDQNFLKKVNDYLYAHISEGTIEVDALAVHMCMSSKQFNRKLFALTGCSAIVYITKQRIARAARMLQSSDERINIIAQKCGFDNPSNFARTFKDTMGCSPSDWRKKYDPKMK